MKNIILIFLVTLFASNIQAQQTPGKKQSENIVVMGATAHLGNGEVIENSIIAFENGKFTLVANQSIGQGFDGYKVIQAEGKHLYPGFIAPNTQIGLKEIDAVRATRDSREIGSLNPNIRSIIAYNTDSKVTPTVRSNGVLIAQVVPQGSTIPGSSSIVQLDAWNWEDAIIKEDDAIYLNWPSMFSRDWRNHGAIKKNDKYRDEVKKLESLFSEAFAYSNKTNTKKQNLKLDAMKSLFDGNKKLYINVNFVKSITAAVLFAEKFDITPVIIGGRDSYMITDFLKKHNVSVILKNTQSLPRREDDAIDQPFKTPGVLEKAGILYGLSIGGAWEQRNLPFQAGQCIPYGLDKESAVRAITLNNAKIMGIDKMVGSIEEGKSATFFICKGDVFDMRTSKVQQAFIDGREIDLNNKQKDLYNKFKAKYEEDSKR